MVNTIREKLLPQDLLVKIPELGFNAETSLAEIVIHVKYFFEPFTWLVAECEVQGDDVLFYGYVIHRGAPFFSEWGSFRLKQLAEVQSDEGFGVELDLQFKSCKFSEYK